MIKRLLLLFLTVVFLGEARAQLFPAQATTQLTPPYSLFLADYVAPGSERLALNVFLRDISRPDINVRFRLRITGQGINIETKPEFIPAPVSLQGGVPLRLIGIDLAEYFEPRNLNFSGISQREYEQRGGLPEGLYQFSFEVLEYNRGVKISNTSSASAWLILNDPPIVNLPRDNDRIRPQDPQQVIFQWTPRHTGSPNAAFTTEYEFKLVEIWPATRNPNDAILTSPPIFETTTRSTTLVYGPAETPLELGRRYAFQIKAKSIVGVEELNLFKNGGKSQVYTFQYGDACYVPQSILAEPVGATRFRVAWDAANGHTSWKLRYRRDTANAAWFTKTSSLPTLEVGSLQPTTTYDYEVMAVCGSFESPYSPIASITTRETPVIAYSCGLPIEEFNLDPSQLIPELKKGDVIDAGDFDVKLQTVSGGNGIFSGEGFIEVPYFNQVKAKVVFENIKVNNDKRLVAGVMNVTGGGVEIVPEGVMDFMDQLSEVLDIADSALNIVDVFVQDNPPDPATFIADTLITVAGPLTVYPDLSNNGSVIVVDGNGNQQTLPPGTNYAITDDKGNGYLVDSKGQVTSTTAAQATASASREFNLTMKFEKASNSLYGLDNKTIAALARNYETLNNNYAVSWKAVAANSNEGVVAKLEDAGIDASLIKYELSGTEIVATTAGEPGKYLLNIIGKSAGTVDELIGRIPAAGENDKEQVLGKLNVVSYDKKPYNLVLVPVNHSDNNKTEYPHNIDQLKASLNKIYSQAVVEWTVRSETNLVVSGLSDTFDDGQSNAFSNYTEDMKKVINAFLAKHSFEEDTYYIFLLNKPKTVSKLGFMPRKKQAGFVFLDTHGGNESLLVKTIAHELAHGAFRLQHLWEEYSELKINTTDNLMDYTSGTTLVKFQWDLIHNPVAVLGLFEDDEEGALLDFIASNPDEFKDVPISGDALVEYIKIRGLWNYGYITSSFEAIADKLQSEYYFRYDKGNKNFHFDAQKWIADKGTSFTDREVLIARQKFEMIKMYWRYVFFNIYNSDRANFTKQFIMQKLLVPTSLKSNGKFSIGLNRESDFPDGTTYYQSNLRKYDFEKLKGDIQYVSMTRNFSRINGTEESERFIETKYEELIYMFGGVMIDIGVDFINNLTDESIKLDIIREFHEIRGSTFDSEVRKRWKFLLSEREKNEREALIRKLVEERLIQIQEAERSAKLDIIIGTASLGFLILFPPTSEAGILMLVAELAQGVYSYDQLYGGINTLNAIRNGVFSPNKEYKLIRGFLVDENGSGGAVIIYDLGNIISGYTVGRDDAASLLDIRNLKSSVIMGDELKSLLKAVDTGVGAYDFKGDVLQFVK